MTTRSPGTGKKHVRKPRKPAARRGARSGLGDFQSLLLGRKRTLLQMMKGLEEETLRGKGGGGEHSSVPVHIADIATDAYEQDLSLGRVENVAVEIRDIDHALERIREGTYGVCEDCSTKISIERLRAIPYTRLCLPCQRKEEERE
jgi:RNA polymerase-binding transcription factor DksA